MVVITRIDLDSCDPLMLSRLVGMGLITVGQAMDAKCIRAMSELHQLLWKRGIEDARNNLNKAG